MVIKGLIASLPDIIGRFGKPNFVIASGDIAYSGTPEEYERATDLFVKLLNILDLERSHLFIVPGNHDIDRRRGVGIVRTLMSSADSDLYFAPGHVLPHIEQRMASFADWYDDFFSGIRAFPRSGTYWLDDLDISDQKVVIAGFNTSIFSYDDDDVGRLFVGRRQVDAAVSALQTKDHTLALAVMHHPFSWLSPIEVTHVKTSLQDAFDCILTGHLHENEIESVAGSSGDSLRLSAGATYQGSAWPNTALICEVSAGSLQITPLRFMQSPRPTWALDTALFPRNPTYQATFPLQPRGMDRTTALPQHASGPTELTPSDSPAIIEARAALEEGLFTTPGNQLLYAEPRLMQRSQVAAIDGAPCEQVTIDDIVTSQDSFIVEARPEYGSSTLGRSLFLALLRSGKRAALRNARDLPNYRKKLEEALSSEIAGGPPFCLIIDDFDYERDERLLSELERSGWASRVVLLSVNRRYSDALIIDTDAMPFKPVTVYLWALGRHQIRQFSEALLSPNDLVSVATAVNKVYSDLLALRIPLTPSNVVMYLKVLQREGDFEPLSRVDILDRYLSESLRKPSDVATDSFNFKNKMDVLSAFAHHLHASRMSSFDERIWLNYCSSYQQGTLTEFDEKKLFNELIESRIFATYGGSVFFRYGFYHTFFLGRYLWPRPHLTRSIFQGDDYLEVADAIDVITGLSSENSEVVSLIHDKLVSHIAEFAEKYVKSDFDPLTRAIWPDDEREGEQLWEPVQKAIAAGPADSRKIDELRTSMIAEARTSDQQVTFRKFTELENALFTEGKMLEDALKNADDVSGELKKAVWKSLLQSVMIVLQVGTMFSPELGRRKRFRWGGIAFIDFDRAAEGYEPGSPEAIVSVVRALVEAVAGKTAKDIGSVKLASVFKTMAADKAVSGFTRLVNFSCLISARGRGWAEAAHAVIEETDKNAYYLLAMLDQLFDSLRHEIMTTKDREAMKRLVALIRAKRSWKTQQPGAKAVTKMFRHLESHQYFPEVADGDSSEEAPRD